MRRVKSNPKSQSKPSSSSSASSSRLKKIPSLLLFALIFFFAATMLAFERERAREMENVANSQLLKRECCECVEWGLGKNFSHSGKLTCKHHTLKSREILKNESFRWRRRSFSGSVHKERKNYYFLGGVGGESKRDCNLLILMKKDMLMNERRWLAY